MKRSPVLPRPEDHPGTTAPPHRAAAILRVLPRLALLLVMSLYAWLGFAQFTPPPVAPANAPATEFSAERAMADLQVIAKQSRLIGSPGNAAARAYLIHMIRQRPAREPPMKAPAS